MSRSHTIQLRAGPEGCVGLWMFVEAAASGKPMPQADIPESKPFGSSTPFSFLFTILTCARDLSLSMWCRTLVWSSWEAGTSLSDGTVYTRSGSALGRSVSGSLERSLSPVGVAELTLMFTKELPFPLEHRANLQPCLQLSGGHVTEFWIEGGWK